MLTVGQMLDMLEVRQNVRSQTDVTDFTNVKNPTKCFAMLHVFLFS